MPNAVCDDVIGDNAMRDKATCNGIVSRLTSHSRISLFILASILCLSLQANDSLRYKIAQMLIVGFRGTEVNAQNHIYQDIQTLHVGGVILFDYDSESKAYRRNISSPSQLKKLCHDLQIAGNGELVIALDQEGGKVNRLKSSAGFLPTVSAQYLGTLNNADTTKQYASQAALQLQKMGVNFSCSPCVDVNVNPACPVIGKMGRSFAAEPAAVVRHAQIWVDQHRLHGVITSPKHFPGHGSSTTDSHLGLTDVSSTWTEAELIPYERLIRGGHCDAVMVAHVFNRNLDSRYPASMSQKIITGLLRERLKFRGLVVTDDMAMGAITEHYSLAEALEKSINAGADMLILSNNGKTYDPLLARKAVDTIAEMVQKNIIPQSRINEAYARKLLTFARKKN
jgi:beta-N-acetylhexosaminidase